MRSYHWLLIVVLTVKTNLIRCDTIGNSTMKPSVVTCTLVDVRDSLKIKSSCDNETVYLFIQGSHFQVFPHVFDFLKKLQSVDISHSGIEYIESSTFEGATHLITLDMGNSNMSTLPGHLFSHVSNLSSLNIENSSIVHVDKYAFHGLSNLKRLDLSFNKIVKLETDIFQPLSSLDTIRLANNKIEIIGSDLFQHNVYLKWVYLNYNEIIFLDPKAFIHSHLKSLDLGFNQLQDVDLTTTKPLNTLIVSNNKLSILKVPPTTEEIQAAKNDISVINADENSELTKLFLSSNNFTNLRSLSKFNKLQFLDLSYNHLRFVQFADLKSLNKLKELKLTGNKLSEIKVDDVITNLPKLAIINLSTKHWSNTYVTQLDEDFKTRNIELLQNRDIIPDEDFTNVTTIQPTSPPPTNPTSEPRSPTSGTEPPSSSSGSFQEEIKAITKRLNDLESKVSANDESKKLQEMIEQMHKELDDKIAKSNQSNDARYDAMKSTFKAFEVIVILMFICISIFVVYKIGCFTKDYLNAMNYRRAQSRDPIFSEQDL